MSSIRATLQRYLITWWSNIGECKNVDREPLFLSYFFYIMSEIKFHSYYAETRCLVFCANIGAAENRKRKIGRFLSYARTFWMRHARIHVATHATRAREIR